MLPRPLISKSSCIRRNVVRVSLVLRLQLFKITVYSKNVRRLELFQKLFGIRKEGKLFNYLNLLGIICHSLFIIETLLKAICSLLQFSRENAREYSKAARSTLLLFPPLRRKSCIVNARVISRVVISRAARLIIKRGGRRSLLFHSITSCFNYWTPLPANV